MSAKVLNPNAYTIGWICALSVESAAAQAFLDERHEVPSEVSDSNSYVTGTIGKHNVVIAIMPQREYGVTTAALTAKYMARSFPQIRMGLMVGIGGGAPSQAHDIRLGDVVISSRGEGTGGVIQFDYGKTIQDQDFKETGHLNQPPTALLTATNALAADYDINGPQLHAKVEKALGKQRKAFQKRYSRPSDNTDRLYLPEVIHPNNLFDDCAATCGTTSEVLVSRPLRSDDDDNPSVHYGLIASSNQVMKDAVSRDKLAHRGILCFEMEAAGLMNHFPCLVIRGICDYADTHKSSNWQPYAAMVAAACAKDLLKWVKPAVVDAEKRLSDKINTVESFQKEQRQALGGMQDRIDALKDQQHQQSFKEWLCPAEPSDNANHAKELRYKKTGAWFLESSAFQEWLNDCYRHLCLYGLSGCGKTVLTSIILDFLREKQEKMILYFFFDSMDGRKRTFNGMVRSLLFQLYSVRDSCAPVLDNLYKFYKDENKGFPSADDLLVCLRFFLEAYEDVLIVLDALDECNQEDVEREKLIKWIIELNSTTSLQHVKIITTARPEAAFLTQLNPNLRDATCMHLDKRAIKVDIEHYIGGCLRDRPGFHTWAPDHPIVKKISTKLIEKADGMFRYAACQIDDLVRCLSSEDIEHFLGSLPETIQETYKRSIERIPRTHISKALRILRFLLNLGEPLPLAAAVDLLAVRSDFREFVPSDRGLEYEIVQLCPNLLAVVDVTHTGSLGVTISREIQFSHLSVKEYLLNSITPLFVGVEASESIVRTCLAYLAGVCSNPPIAAEKYPFLSHAQFMWIDQSAVAEGSSSAVTAMADHLQRNFEIFRPSWQLQMEYFERLFGEAERHSLIDFETSCLHFTCFRGLQATAKLLVSRGVELSIHQEASSITPIEYATHKRQTEFVRLFLESGAHPDVNDLPCRRALQVASETSYYEVVSLLAEHGADLHTPLDTFGCLTPGPHSALQIAISRQDLPLVKLLLDFKVDVNAYCGFHKHILEYPSILGYREIVDLLVRKGADVNAPSRSHANALQAAALGGSRQTVAFLISRGADYNKLGGLYGSALQAAAQGGHQDVVQLLLQCGADINAQGGFHGTAIAAAAIKGHPETAVCLLERRALINTPSTPCQVILKQMLVERKHMSMRRWNIRYNGIFQILLEAGSHSFDTCPLDQELQPSVASGCHGTKRSFLALEASSNERDRGFQQRTRSTQDTAPNSRIFQAVDANPTEGERVRLRARKGADPNVISEHGRGTLMEALIEVDAGTAKALLRLGADPNSTTSRMFPNQTALHVALGHATCGNYVIASEWREVVKLLLEKGADPNTMCGIPPWIPLRQAVNGRSLLCVDLLLEHGADVFALGADKALDLAREEGNEKILEVLKRAIAEKTGPKRKCAEPHDDSTQDAKRSRT